MQLWGPHKGGTNKAVARDNAAKIGFLTIETAKWAATSLPMQHWILFRAVAALFTAATALFTAHSRLDISAKPPYGAAPQSFIDKSLSPLLLLLLREHTNPSTRRAVGINTKPCAARELCLVPDHTAERPDGDECRGKLRWSTSRSMWLELCSVLFCSVLYVYSWEESSPYLSTAVLLYVSSAGTAVTRSSMNITPQPA